MVNVSPIWIVSGMGKYNWITPPVEVDSLTSIDRPALSPVNQVTFPSAQKPLASVREVSANVVRLVTPVTVPFNDRACMASHVTVLSVVGFPIVVTHVGSLPPEVPATIHL